MTETIEAVFDVKVFHPEGKVDLIPNKHYTLIVHDKNKELSTSNVWDILDELTGTIDAPEDWALEHDHYLYGAPRKGGNDLP